MSKCLKSQTESQALRVLFVLNLNKMLEILLGGVKIKIQKKRKFFLRRCTVFKYGVYLRFKEQTILFLSFVGITFSLFLFMKILLLVNWVHVWGIFREFYIHWLKRFHTHD